MPDCYTHSLVAQQALMRSGQVVASHPAFLAGANGPDPLYAYQAWKRKREPNLPALGKRLHRESTGAFLVALVQFAMTPAQQSYALGFLTHYAADCTLHPYVAAMCRKGMPYSRNQGHIRMEASMDSTLYYRDYKTYQVPVHAGTPVLIGEDLAQVVLLLREALLHVYGMDVPVVALSDTFHHNLRVRKFLTSRNPIKKMVAGWIETRVLGPKGRNAIRGRMQPAPPLERMPTNWSNPFDGMTHNLTIEEIMVEAEEAGALFISAAMRLWLGEAEVDELAAMLGSLDYYTGQPEGTVAIEKSDVPYFISK